MSGSRFFGKSLDGTKLCLLVVFSAFVFHSFQKYISANSTVFYSTEDFIRSYGYPVETHSVVTADGYILDIHRIPNKKGSNASSGPPILFQHGFLCTSSIWVFQGPSKDLAFILSDEGYDIWLLNARGSSYTRLHPNATIEYNDYSYHEMAIYDLPASIDYVIQTTGYSNVSYVAHSMGTTLMFAALSARPEYNAKVNHVSAIAAMTTRSPLTNPVHKFLVNIYVIIGDIGNELFDVFSIHRRNILRSIFSRGLSTFLPNLANEMLRNGFKGFAGGNSTCHISIPTEVLHAHNPDGFSHKTLNHFYQNMMADSFRQRDYGAVKNKLIYNETVPPLYNLKNIKTPITGYLGMADEISPGIDFINSMSSIRDRVKIRRYKNFNHFDVIWAKEAINTLFVDVVESLRKANLFHPDHRLKI